MGDTTHACECSEPPGTIPGASRPHPGNSSLPATPRTAQGENHLACLTLPFYLSTTPRQSGIGKRRSDSRTERFRKRFFPESTPANWNDWRWQMANRITTADGISPFLELTLSERSFFSDPAGAFPFAITPYYLSLLWEHPADYPLRRSIIPTVHERSLSPGEAIDPLDEGRMSPVPGLVHRYPDRVLFLATTCCAAFCRYCTRSRIVGEKRSQGCRPERDGWLRCLAYIREHTQVRDVLVSGGDPLTLSDDTLGWLLESLRAIPHVEIIRLGTKAPAVLPQRITPALVRMLRRHHPLLMSLHVTHPDELTAEMVRACNRLADAGIVLGSQTVLLAGINDNTTTLRLLFQGLLKCRVRPYYLYQCDPIAGSSHFRTPVSRGHELMRSLRGHTTGYAIPTYVIDAPGGGGKIPVGPQYLEGHDGNNLMLRNYEGDLYCYPDPQAKNDRGNR